MHLNPINNDLCAKEKNAQGIGVIQHARSTLAMNSGSNHDYVYILLFFND